MRTSGRPLGCRLHHLDEGVPVDLKIGEIRRAVRFAKRERLAESHLPAVEIDRTLVVGNAHRHVIERGDAPLLRPARLDRDANKDAREKDESAPHRCTACGHPASIGLAGSAVICRSAQW